MSEDFPDMEYPNNRNELCLGCGQKTEQWRVFVKPDENFNKFLLGLYGKLPERDSVELYRCTDSGCGYLNPKTSRIATNARLRIT